MENKNALLALFLLMLVLITFQFLNPPMPPTPTQEKEVPAQIQPSAPQEVNEAVTKVEPVAVKGVVTGEVVDVVVENEFFRAVLSSKGGVIKEFALKKYRQTAAKEAPPVQVVFPESGVGSVLTSSTGNFGLGEGLLFAIKEGPTNISLEKGQKGEIVFQGVLENGLQIQKIYTFYGDSYPMDLSLRLLNGGQQPLSGEILLSLVDPPEVREEGSRFDYVGPTTHTGEEVIKEDLDDLKEKASQYGRGVLWTGFEDKYFLNAVIGKGAGFDRALVRDVFRGIETRLETSQITLQPGESVALDSILFFGPKDLDILKGVGHQLSEVIDFGFFAPIARPLLYIIKFFYRFVGNYGVAIILLTVIIKLIFWPLTQKQFTSMKAMQKLQPEMAKVRERFKNDRERQSRELMALYKKHRVNPLGGCLPMVVQIPVFFALYKALLSAIELRHAHFFLWITDLSVKDPFYITPIIMGGTMFLQQKMSPTTMDPNQAKIFMLMPIIFTFLFLNFPAGLVIYWLVNNVLTIGQQALIQRKD